MATVALDIYGTLVDPLEMDEHLRPMAGETAPQLSALWRQKQLEYTFRRGLMDAYSDFGTVTVQALDFAAASFGLTLDEGQRKYLISEYQNLRAFPDVVSGIENFRASGFGVVAFSNGIAETTRNLLTNAGVLELLDGVVSVDDVRTFKPSPKVYEHLCTSLNLPKNRVCLVSSNPFDVIGARHSGLLTAWLDRGTTPFDPWDIPPHLVASNLPDLAERLPDILQPHPAKT